MIWVRKLSPFFEIVSSQTQTFLLVSDRYIGAPLRNNNIKFCKFGEKNVSVFPHNRKYHKGLSPCKGFFEYIYLSSFISQILDFLYHTESISIFDGVTVITGSKELEDE